jgi:pimeloyl-ACP methyl ester carboxylesterase
MDLLAGYADVNGASLYYETAGAGTGLVFIHGMGADARVWDAQVEFFARRCQVVRYDMRGFGRSTLPVEGLPYTHTADLLALLHSLGLSSAILVGHSMGGAIALDFALSYPETAPALVLVDAVMSGFEMSQAWNDSWAPVYSQAAVGGMQAALPLLLRHPLFSSANARPAVASRLAEILSDYSGWHAQHADPGIELDPPAIQRLCEVHASTLVVVGEKDLNDFQVSASLLANNIPGARRVIVPGAGHVLPLEAPDRFNHLLSGFLAGIRTTESRQYAGQPASIESSSQIY